MNDTALKRLVEDELEWTPMVDESDIGVLVENGVITLTGTVRSHSEKLAAEAAVKRVKGVRAVVEQLEVHFLGPPELSDAEIARRAINGLDWDVSIPKGRVMIMVERLETWVTDCTGHMGNTSRFGGRLRCHGRNNQKWTRGYALLPAGLKASR